MNHRESPPGLRHFWDLNLAVEGVVWRRPGVDRGKLPRFLPLAQFDAYALLGGRSARLARVVAVGAEALPVDPEGLAWGGPRRFRPGEGDGARGFASVDGAAHRGRAEEQVRRCLE